MTQVLTTSPGFARQGDLPDRVAALGWSLTRQVQPDAAALARADYIVAGLTQVSQATLDAAPRLKGVLKHGVGTDSIDIAACTARGIPVLNTPGANANAVAELALGVMLSVLRNIAPSHRAVLAGSWERRPGGELAGRVLGIVGLGAIGRLLAAKAIALGMEVVASDPFADPASAPVPLLPLDTLLDRSDIVSLHLAGTAMVIGPAQVAAMKPGAVLLNLARGGVVDLDALAGALVSGHLGGAALDAYPVEPPDLAHPIFAAPNVTFTPHSGADTVESMLRMGRMVIEDIETLTRGGRPARCLNPEVFR